MREILKEDAYKRETGKRYTGDIDKFRDTAGKPGYYIHLTDVPKIGVNPKSNFLPGLYLYPHSKSNFQSLIMGHRGNFIAGNMARYAFLVKLRSDLKILKPDDLNDYLNKKYFGIVGPIIDEMLDVRILKEPENAKKFYSAGGEFYKSTAAGDLPAVEVTAEMLERLGNNVYEESAEKIVRLINSFIDIQPLSGKQLKARAAELNAESAKTLEEIMGKGFVNVKNGTPYVNFASLVQHGEQLFGVAYSKTGAIISSSIRKAIENLKLMVADITTVKGERPSIDREKIEKRKRQSGDYGARNDKLLTLSKSIQQQTAALYFFLMRASGSSTRSKAIGYIMDNTNNNQLAANGGGKVLQAKVIERIRIALLDAMSTPTLRMTPQRLKGKDEEEINILFALGGDDWDGVEDKGTVDNTVRFGSLGRETQQTFIKAPINQKLEGGGPVVMLDRMEGLPADKTPKGSTQGTDYMNYEPESPRELELQKRYSRPGAHKGKPNITREKFATARDYPEKDA